MTPEFIQILSEHGATGLLLLAVIALWRRLEIISNRVTEKYEAALKANTEAMIRHAAVVEADATRIQEQTRSIDSLTRQLAEVEGAAAGRFHPCAPVSRD